MYSLTIEGKEIHGEHIIEALELFATAMYRDTKDGQERIEAVHLAAQSLRYAFRPHW